MLVEFTVKNFLSIKEEQVLSLAKAKGDELAETNSFDPKAPSSVPLLRSSVIYGANAAGKSNLIRALHLMQLIVVTSASTSHGDEIPVTPFLFDKASSEEPTEFEVVFLAQGVRYQYGFAATQKRVISEWLIAYPHGRPQRWFSREYNKEKDSSDYGMGNSFLGQKAIWQNSTRNNALFLSTAIQLNSEQLKPVYNWFKDSLNVSSTAGWGHGFTASLCDKKDKKERILAFLKSADFNIHDISVEREMFNPDSLSDEIPTLLKKEIISNMKDKEILDIKTIHKTSDNNLVSLDIDDESDGTQKFFSFAGPWLDTLENGYVMVVDELHDSLHPKMVKYLVELFHDSKTNPKNAQLIFTTHETSILNQDVFRRDQVWFCEKNEEQATELYPLTDFSPRKERENLELGYLSGRYGAIPYVRTPALFEDM